MEFFDLEEEFLVGMMLQEGKEFWGLWLVLVLGEVLEEIYYTHQCFKETSERQPALAWRH